MRYIYFLLFAVLMTSCAHNRLRLVKVHKKDRTETVAQHEEKTKKARKSDQKREIVVVQEEAIATKTIVEEPTRGLKSENKPSTAALKDVEKNEELSEVSDEIEEDEPSKGRKLQEAIAAEQLARKAKNSFIWAIIMLFLIFIPFVPLFSIIPFIIGSIRLSQSTKFDYITPQGERDESTARIIQIIYGAIFLITVLAVLALILLL